MAHFAKIGKNDIVEQVIVIDNQHETNASEFIKSLGFDGEWIQTSYNHNIRGKFAGIGDKYDRAKDEFYSIPKEIISQTKVIEVL